VLALLAPGQGAQSPGMLAGWLELPAVADRLRWASAVTGVDLVAAGSTADTESIRDTAVAQPLLVATALAVAAELDGATRGDPRAGRPLLPAESVVAGHSVGELAAAALAGALSVEAALALVAARGREMAAAAAAAPPTGMTAVIGGAQEEVLAALDRHGLVAANVNAPGQLVAAGPQDALDRLAADPPPGTRLRRLSVAGAFHTPVMAPAAEALSRLAAGVPVRDPHLLFVSNADGAVVSSGTGLLDRLVTQVAAPVRWDACQATMADLGVQAIIELPPAGTLSGLARRALPDVETLALKSPDDLPAARRLLAAASPVQDATETPPWRLVVAPLGGTLHRDPVAGPGRPVPSGAVLGTVESRRATVPVAVAAGGVLVEWLAGDGDPVGPGQPIARLQPDELAAANAGGAE
jgi:[acyl-carrier-protein] S-malonyltransferase